VDGSEIFAGRKSTAALVASFIARINYRSVIVIS
jgi:hypothetical protein